MNLKFFSFLIKLTIFLIIFKYIHPERKCFYDEIFNPLTTKCECKNKIIERNKFFLACKNFIEECINCIRNETDNEIS